MSSPPSIRNGQPMIAQAIALHQQGRLDDAATIYKAVLKTQPKHFDALNLLGVVRAQQGRFDDARDCLKRALKEKPSDIGALSNYALVLTKLNRAREAVACYDRLLARKPDYAEGYNNRGNALRDLKQPADALASYDKAISLKPDYADGHNNRGTALRDLDRHAEALSSYDTAIALNSSYANAYLNRGNCLNDLDRHVEALVQYDRAIVLSPDDPEHHVSRGSALNELKRYRDAMISIETALALKPEHADAMAAKAFALYELGENSGAVIWLRKSLELKPDDIKSRWSMTIAALPVIAQSADEQAQSRRAFSAALDDLARHAARHPAAHEAVGQAQPFYLAYHDQNNRELLERYGRICVKAMQPIQRKLAAGRAASRDGSSRRLRLGIVSAHVYDHSVWNALLKGWMQHLDREQFEVHLFDLGRISDHETEWARSHATVYHQGFRKLDRWSQVIADSHLDALLYAEIGMDQMTVKLASLRLAPLQLATWGHPETTGLATIDTFLSAEALEPPDALQSYTERLVKLPRLGCCITPLAVEAADIDLAALGIDATKSIVLCPGAAFKYTPRSDDVFVEIAERAAECRLVFFRPSDRPEFADKLRDRLTTAFTRRNMTLANHAVFIPWLSRPKFYALMRRSTLMLDTLGFSGFNTALQAVECGLPVVASEGRFLRGRLASGLLRSMGLDELVAVDDQQFVDLVVELTANAARRSELSSRIVDACASIFNDTESVRGLERYLFDAVAGSEKR